MAKALPGPYLAFAIIRRLELTYDTEVTDNVIKWKKKFGWGEATDAEL